MRLADGGLLVISPGVLTPERCAAIQALHVGRPEHSWTKLYMKAMGFYDRIAFSHVLR